MNDAPSFLDELSSKQKEILAAVKLVIEQAGAVEYDQSIERSHETYVLIQDDHFKIFIFENGETQIHSVEPDGEEGFRQDFELSDFPDFAGLKMGVLETLARLLTTH